MVMRDSLGREQAWAGEGRADAEVGGEAVEEVTFGHWERGWHCDAGQADRGDPEHARDSVNGREQHAAVNSSANAHVAEREQTLEFVEEVVCKGDFDGFALSGGGRFRSR